MTVEPSVECDMCKGDGSIVYNMSNRVCTECKGRGYEMTRFILGDVK